MDKQILSQIDLFLLDMDGTLYLGDRLFDCTLPFLNAVKKAGKRYLFMTNNSSRSVADYVKKLEKLGIPAQEADFVTSSQATVRYLKKHHEGARLYVCGTRSLQKELTDAGFDVTNDTEKTDCIVMGFDTELTFQKLRDVSYLLATRDLPYIATNPDYVCPTEFGSVPDCGSVCDMIYNATGKRPFVIGKPQPFLPRYAMEKYGVAPERTAVVGDRIYTDVASGIAAGCVSILVLSGETDEKILAKSKEKPDLVLKDCGEIVEYL